MEKDVLVALGDEIKIVKGVKWNTTAEEIIKRVLMREDDPALNDAQLIKRYILLEVWRGCVCPLKYEDKVLRVLHKWGFAVEGEPVPVRLKIIRRSQYFQHSTDKREKYHLGGRVATRKRHSIQRKKSKRRLVTEVGQLTYKSSKVQGDITKLTIPPKPQKMEVNLPIDVSTLPPELEDECVALQEEYEEERKESADLLRRKDELTSNILSQKTDTETLMQTISSLEAKILNEQHKLNRVIETSGPPELIEAQKEVNKLQSELKVRTKLNQLQSAKLRELGTVIDNTEQEITEHFKKLDTN